MIHPVLTPQGVDAGRPFPRMSGLSVSLVALVKDMRGDVKLARVKVPDSLPQLLAGAGGGVRAAAWTAREAAPIVRFVWIEEVVKANLGELFPGLEIVEAYPVRVTRDADVAIKELESDDLLETIEAEIWQRRFRGPVRLQVAEDLPEHMLSLLARPSRSRPGRHLPLQVADGAQAAVAAGGARPTGSEVRAARPGGSEAAQG